MNTEPLRGRARLDSLSALLVPLVWPGLGGRDFRPAGVVLAVVLVSSAAVFRLRLEWS